MRYLMILMFLVGCTDLPTSKPTWTATLCNNLICFPGVVEFGREFDSRAQCEKAIKGKTDPDQMKFYYCQED